MVWLVVVVLSIGAVAVAASRSVARESPQSVHGPVELSGSDFARGETESIRPPAEDLSAALGPYIFENQGQLRDPRVRYYMPTGRVLIGFADSEVFWTTTAPSSPEVTMRAVFDGAATVRPEGREVAGFRTHYLLGSDPSLWHHDVSVYRAIVYPDLYPGIDLHYRIADGRLKYEFVLAAGADPSAIAIRVLGAESLEVSENSMLIRTQGGGFIDGPLESYQGADQVTCRFVIRDSIYGFTCPRWDSSRSLVIDPYLYSTWMGGGGLDHGWDIALDSSGSAYLTGRTIASIYPTSGHGFPTTPGAFDTNFHTGSDVFVAKLSPDGSSLVFSTFLGGASDDIGYSIAVDATGRVYVTGSTLSIDFPTTSGAYDTVYNGTPNGNPDAFVARLGAFGDVLEYSTFLGGNAPDEAHALAVDTLGNAYVTGTTLGYFPVTNGTWDTNFTVGLLQGFVAKLDPTGAGLLYATYFGGTEEDEPLSCAVNSAGEFYVSGWTESSDFPTTPGAFDPSYSWPLRDGFVTRFNSNATGLVFSTYLGGSSIDEVRALALDASGYVYLAGHTQSSDFPTTPGAYNITIRSTSEPDAFITKMSPGGESLALSTYLGGSYEDFAYGLAVDSSGNMYVTGETWSYDFPITSHAIDAVHGDVCICEAPDVFVSKLDAAGEVLVSSTYLGSENSDIGLAIAIDAIGNAFVTGYGENAGGVSDVFVAAIDLNAPPVAEVNQDNLSVTINTPVKLDASSSHDPDKDPLSFVWTVTSGALLAIQGVDAPVSTVNAPQPGEYSILLTVRDPYLSYSQKVVRLHVTEAASAGRDSGVDAFVFALLIVTIALAVVPIVIWLVLRRRRPPAQAVAGEASGSRRWN